MRVLANNGSVICIHDVTNGNTTRLPQLLRLLPEFFPACEKFLPWLAENAVMPLDLRSPVVPHQWVIEVDGETAGLFVFDYRPRRNCGLLLFAGLYPQFRALQVGSFERLAHFLVSESIRQISADARLMQRPAPLGLTVEVEVPALLNRYRLYDFIELPVVYYEPMFPEPLTRMTENVALESVAFERVTLGLFHGGNAPATDLTSEQVANLALAFLADFYRLPDTSLPVQQARATARPFVRT